MTPAKLTLSERRLAESIAAFSEALKDCTPEELLAGRAIAEILDDARLRMADLERRMRNRMGGES